MKKNHPFHMVTSSPWPILTSLTIFMTMNSTIEMFHNKNSTMMMLSMTTTITCLYQWWRDITRESSFQGMHTKKVNQMMKSGMILFIVSEVMFFSSFFWSFFHSSLSPSIEIGMNWPPKSIYSFNPMEIPLLNTIILLSSGMSITWAHNSILSNKFKLTNKATMITIIMGLIFTTLQWWEYTQSPFTISDSIYGSTFFMATGFHGIHVIVGTMFIFFSKMRNKNFQLTHNHHSGFEMAIWYWHFVDIVWLFLYISIYWWGK
nr:cytochrome c oxidase subunit III [Borysthenes sp. 2 WQW-2023a]